MNTINDIHQNRPPRVAADSDEDQVFSATTGAAASADLWAGYTKIPEGKCWIELDAVTKDVYVRFGSAVTTATDATNGGIVPAGQYRRFYVDPSKDVYLDHASPGGAGTIKWRRVGHICERTRQ